MKRSSFAFLVILSAGLLVACNRSGTASLINDLDTPPVTEDSGAMPQGRVIDIVVRGGAFEPDMHRLARNENVVLRITSEEPGAVFISEALHLSIPLERGKTKAFNVPTDTAGTFLFHGNPGATRMVGQFIIE